MQLSRTRSVQLIDFAVSGTSGCHPGMQHLLHFPDASKTNFEDHLHLARLRRPPPKPQRARACSAAEPPGHVLTFRLGSRGSQRSASAKPPRSGTRSTQLLIRRARWRPRRCSSCLCSPALPLGGAHPLWPQSSRPRSAHATRSSTCYQRPRSGRPSTAPRARPPGDDK
jgi:hypothetical protein